MTLRRRTTRAGRARGKLARLMKAVRSLAVLRLVAGALRRRRSLALALRTSPIGLLVGGVAVWLLARRRRRARLEADLGPPNESAPGHVVPPPTAAASPPEPAVAAEPNEGAPGHRPDSEAAEASPASP